MKRSAPCATVLCHLPSSWAAVVHWSALIVHWSALMPKTPRSSREYLIHSFPSPPTQPAPPTNSPNITYFGNLVSSIRATNSASKIHLLPTLVSMLSLPILRSFVRLHLRSRSRSVSITV